MEIQPDTKLLLDEVDTAIEQAFNNGVTSSGDYLPALPLYDRLKAEDKAKGRQGILATFAAMLDKLLSFRPTKITLSLQNNWTDNDPSNESLSAIKKVTGEVLVSGIVKANTNLSAITVITQLPEGYRPAKYRHFPACKNGTTFIDVTVDPSGYIWLSSSVSTNDWVSIENVQFYPA